MAVVLLREVVIVCTVVLVWTLAITFRKECLVFFWF